MIYVIASITITPGKRDDFIEIFKANVAAVRRESGCIEYQPTVDTVSGLDRQTLDEDVVTIIEKWTDIDALNAHLQAPHMLAYKEAVKDLVVGVALKILEDA